MVCKMDFAMIPTRYSLMPPEVDPAAPPTAISSAMVKNAPLVRTTINWFGVMTEKPVVVKAEITMYTPRRRRAGISANKGEPERDATKTPSMTATQMNMVRVSISRKKGPVFPFQTS